MKKKDILPLLDTTLQYSSTPVLQHSSTPTLQHSSNLNIGMPRIAMDISIANRLELHPMPFHLIGDRGHSRT